MRKMITVVAAVLVGLAVLIQLVPYGHDHSNPPVTAEPQWNSPEVRALAQRACFDCHSNQTVWPWYSNVAPASWLIYGDVVEGRRRLNFSEWNRPEGQYVDEFSEVFYEKNMPPANYLLLHPNARLTDAEWKQLFNGLASIAANFHH
jgi:hypothetical protein